MNSIIPALPKGGEYTIHGSLIPGLPHGTLETKGFQEVTAGSNGYGKASLFEHQL